MKENETHFIIIPAEVLHCKKIPANAKLLYGEILDLCNDKGYCWAGNNYFANLFGVSNTSISLWIKCLQGKGFIKCKIEKNNSRKIFLKGDTKKFNEGVLRKLKHIYKGQEHPSGNAPANTKDDFEIETKEWKDNKGQVHGRDSIDYGS